ncbi:hypothetical protein KUG88_28120 [Rhodococcus rhodochrous]|uniref:hypothetical protein n=1 Tax=Rhodococcus rhodochrous TaxID=1829 RepID=UPI001E42126C|nr:hypothetical protein [Rhodococcus rhodochrous]MCB8913971.1 hypothetical protein [Rhodococcus rhodochrous]
MNPNDMPRRTNQRRTVPITADEITRLSNRIDTLEEQLRDTRQQLTDTRELLAHHRTWTHETLQALLDLIDAVAGIDE